MNLEEELKQDEGARKVIKEVRKRNEKYVQVGFMTLREAERFEKGEKARLMVEGMLGPNDELVVS